jgi:hypothetical protein
MEFVCFVCLFAESKEVKIGRSNSRRNSQVWQKLPRKAVVKNGLFFQSNFYEYLYVVASDYISFLGCLLIVAFNRTDSM